MEQFTLPEGDHTLKDSRELINNALMTVRSLSAGNAFPTTDLSEGMLCYRTDLKRLYYLADAASKTWSDKLPADLGGTASAVAWANITGKPSTYPAASHTHSYAGASSAGGAATSASKLATARTINGVSFDGTQNITIINTVAQGGTGASTAANARKNLGLTTAVTGASISGKTITLTCADSTTKTLTTQDTAPFTARATSIGGATTTKPAVVVTTYKSGANGYRVWSDGFIEQWGTTAAIDADDYVVTFPKAFTSTNYHVNFTVISSTETKDGVYGHQILARTTTSFTAHDFLMNALPITWYACGT